MTLTRSRWLPGACIATAWLLALAALRFGLMEISADQDPCLRDAEGLACEARAALGYAIHFRFAGCTAVAIAVLALLVRGPLRRALAAVGLAVALFALMLYNADLGSVAGVLALLAFADPGTTPRSD